MVLVSWSSTIVFGMRVIKPSDNDDLPIQCLVLGISILFFLSIFNYFKLIQNIPSVKTSAKLQNPGLRVKLVKINLLLSNELLTIAKGVAKTVMFSQKPMLLSY